ncbi:RIP metalloprotease RseP [Puteibacter caeruleilacunae]|nr:RIP metalloprotease RseP [Puteibacter caeruleilacunae]
MEILIKASQLLLSLSILVILHEFGHFMFAKIFKCRVEKFYLFFDPWFSLLKTRKGETEYGIGWLPLGGYVKISGMIDESMDKEAMKEEPKEWEFRSKPAWQRLLIMIGGVMMNFIFAILIYIGILYAYGKQYLPNENAVHGIVVNEVGEEIGLRTGDKILEVNGNVIEDFYKIVPSLILEKAENIKVNRGGEVIVLPITNQDLAVLLKKSKGIISPRVLFDIKVGKLVKNSPAKKAGFKVGDEFVAIDGNKFTYYDQFAAYLKDKKSTSVNVEIHRDGTTMQLPVEVDETGRLGFYPAFNEGAELKHKTLRYGFLESVPAGLSLGWTTVKDYLKQFKLIFTPETKAYESLGGFISIGNIFPGQWNWHSFWNMTALLSLILGIMNLLPIPALDGGHVLFLLYEMVSGRKPGDKFLEYAQIGGMILLLALVLYANVNDVIKYIFK